MEAVNPGAGRAALDYLPGPYRVMAGASSEDLPLKADFAVVPIR